MMSHFIWAALSSAIVLCAAYDGKDFYVQNPLCEQHPPREQLNATGSVSTAAFDPTASGSSSANWTWNVGLSTIGTMRQIFWIDGADELYKDDVPFDGCVLIVMSLPLNISRRGENDNGDCVATLGQQCVSDLRNQYASVARSRSGVNGTGTSFQCNGTVALHTPASCVGTLGPNVGVGYGQSLSGVSRLNVPINDTEHCGQNETNGYRAIAELESGEIDEQDIAKENFTLYDQWATTIYPVIATAWLKSNTTATEPWGDSRVMCLRGRKLSSGSRVVNSVPNSASSFVAGIWVDVVVFGLFVLAFLL